MTDEHDLDRIARYVREAAREDLTPISEVDP